MARWMKVVIWVVVLGACAGAGAYVAANTDPFPPGVDDPGARDEPSAEPDGDAPAAAEVRRWRVVVRSTSTHVFRVGGSCRTTWRAGFRVREREEAVEGGGLARLVAGPVCDFPVAQVQADAVDLSLVGTIADDVVTFELRTGDTSPTGAVDAGGFLETIEDAAFAAGDGERAQVVTERPDGREGTFRTVTSVSLRCVQACAG